MDKLFLTDENQLPELLNEVRDFACGFRSDDSLPAGSTLTSVPEENLPLVGAGAQDAMEVFLKQWVRYLVASPSNRYLGYVTGGTTPAALLGDWLASAADQNPQAVKGFGDVSAAIEIATIRMLRELFVLPDTFNGGFVTGATMSSFTCLGVARQWVGRQQGYDVAKDGLQQPVPVLTATPHSSAVKCLAMLGIGSRNIVKVDTLPGREAMDVDDLQQKITSLNGAPFILIASGGTVNTVDFDDLLALARIREKHPCWIHVDAAFGGFAAISPDHAYLLAGWEMADSITVDNHKWLNVPYDSACWFVRADHAPLQVATFQNSSAPYLGDPAADFNYLNVGPENSRRLRALPAWFSLQAYGRSGYEDIVTRCIRTAFLLGEAISASPRFELLAEVKLNVVAFTIVRGTAEQVDALAHQLNERGKYFLTPTTLFGRRGLRAAFVNWQCQTAQVEEIMAELNTAHRELSLHPASAP
ncbi:pyridoxal phosphate-dependent decarboxylase family protein [Neolewinella agarilytica]|uniref:Glutamate or tyrosine decarboxylase n=1 Tax=Neolewinella agarilytica TaxID=478744 RepID=A0A1H9P8Q7_9BACT|nr:pyridoxal-dependent decarboxylase [Neolewinella agarilytica]SER44471.1 Glutamate or tyrosine decarboxylase [Neolewinella agarilytica]